MRCWNAAAPAPLITPLGIADPLPDTTGPLTRSFDVSAHLPRRLAGFLAAPDVVLLGRETIYRDGVRAGWLASGGYGYTLRRAIGYGYVREPKAGVSTEFVLSGTYELEVAGERVPADVFLDPPYDPKGNRIKA